MKVLNLMTYHGNLPTVSRINHSLRDGHAHISSHHDTLLLMRYNKLAKNAWHP